MAMDPATPADPVEPTKTIEEQLADCQKELAEKDSLIASQAMAIEAKNATIADAELVIIQKQTAINVEKMTKDQVQADLDKAQTKVADFDAMAAKLKKTEAANELLVIEANKVPHLQEHIDGVEAERDVARSEKTEALAMLANVQAISDGVLQQYSKLEVAASKLVEAWTTGDIPNIEPLFSELATLLPKSGPVDQPVPPSPVIKPPPTNPIPPDVPDEEQNLGSR